MTNTVSTPDTVADYTKKPVTIQAVKWTGENIKAVMDFMNWRNASHDERDGLRIHTLEGNLSASVGDFIIRGVKGEFYACKPDIFEATYSVAAAPVPAEPVGGEPSNYAEARDAVLNERGPLEGMGLTGEQINAVLAILDEYASPATPPLRDAAGVPPGEWGGLSPKQAWWSGYRVGKGLPPDMPRVEAIRATPPSEGSDTSIAGDAVRETLKMAIRQNSHDMLMTGDEIRQCEAALRASSPASIAGEIKDHEIAKLVNDLRDIAVTYGQTQQLRERIAHRLLPALRASVPAGSDGTAQYIRGFNDAKAQFAAAQGDVVPAGETASKGEAMTPREREVAMHRLTAIMAMADRYWETSAAARWRVRGELFNELATTILRIGSTAGAGQATKEQAK